MIDAIRFWFSRLQHPGTLLVAALLASCFQAGLLVAVPLVVRYTFIELVPEREFGSLAIAGALLIAAFLLQTTVHLVTRMWILGRVKSATAAIRTELVGSFYSASQRRLDNTDGNTLHHLLVHDAERGDQMLNAALATALPSTVSIALLIVAVIWVNPILGATLAVLVGPAIVLVNLSFGTKLKVRIQRFHAGFERFSTRCFRMIEAADLTRTHAVENFETKRANAEFEQLNQLSRDSVLADSLYRALQQSSLAVGGVITLIVGGALISETGFTTGDLLSFYTAVLLLRGSASGLLANHRVLNEGGQATRRIKDWFDTEDTCPYHGTQAVRFAHSIHVDGISFGYGDKTVLQDISFTLERGKVTALIGLNGSGKTTIVDLLLGFYRPNQGHLKVDGIDYDEVDLRYLRSQMGCLRQEPILFDGTLLENLTYGEPSVSEDKIGRALTDAAADVFVDSLPNGLQTPIGEHARRLSGGQKQRIALARTLLRAPSLLILDEPTNHLDTVSISRVVDRLKTLPNSPGVLLVTHDQTLIETADHVIDLSSTEQNDRTKSSEQIVRSLT